MSSLRRVRRRSCQNKRRFTEEDECKDGGDVEQKESQNKGFDYDHALKLSGKMAVAAHLVINSSAMNLSARLDVLQDAIEKYDNYILCGVRS